MEEQIFYRGIEYNLDSIILGDYEENNKYNPSHIIAGITCKKLNMFIMVGLVLAWILLW